MTKELFLENLAEITNDCDAFMAKFSYSTIRSLSPEEMSALTWPPITGTPSADNTLVFYIATSLGDQRSALERITVPTLIVHPANGTIFPTKAQIYMEQHIQQCKRVQIGKSHVFSLEDPQGYFREIDEFLTENGVKAST